jgi:hypothetical protein
VAALAGAAVLLGVAASAVFAAAAVLVLGMILPTYFVLLGLRVVWCGQTANPSISTL